MGRESADDRVERKQCEGVKRIALGKRTMRRCEKRT